MCKDTFLSTLDSLVLCQLNLKKISSIKTYFDRSWDRSTIYWWWKDKQRVGNRSAWWKPGPQTRLLVNLSFLIVNMLVRQRLKFGWIQRMCSQTVMRVTKLSLSTTAYFFWDCNSVLLLHHYLRSTSTLYGGAFNSWGIVLCSWSLKSQ